MGGNIVALVAAALIFECGVASASPMVYNVNIGGIGEAVSGTITTDGNTGAIDVLFGPVHITAWEFTASGFLPLSLTSTAPGAKVNCAGVGCGLTAVTAEIFTFYFSGNEAVTFGNLIGGSISFDRAHGAIVQVSPPLEQVFIAGPFTFPAALASIPEPAPIPEPSTFTLLGIALAGLGFARRRPLGRRGTAV